MRGPDAERILAKACEGIAFPYLNHVLIHLAQQPINTFSVLAVVHENKPGVPRQTGNVFGLTKK